MSHLRAAVAVTVLLTGLTGVVYPLAVTGIAEAVFPAAAGGSLIRRDGAVVGSALIGQAFTDAGHFHGRPSATTRPDPADATRTVAAPYNAAASAGSNLAPTSATLVAAVAERARALGDGPQPADLVTASASGLDPDISPAAARVQVARVAAARGLAVAAVARLVESRVEGRTLGVFGEPRVNVLALNLALDKLAGSEKAPAP
jgi:K+-transporting ATPase ATPase C chain